MKKFFVFILLIGLAGGGWWAWQTYRPDKRPIEVELVEAGPGEVVKTLSLRGRSRPVARAEAVAMVEGRLESVLVKLDQTVAKGGLAAEMTVAPAFMLKVQEALADYQAAQVALEQQSSRVIDSPAAGRIQKILVKPGQKIGAGSAVARMVLESAFLGKLDEVALEIDRLTEAAGKQRRNLDAAEALAAKGLGSGQAVEAARAELDALERAIKLRQSQLSRLSKGIRRLGGRSNEALLLSPWSGRVLRIVKQPGQMVGPGENGAIIYLSGRNSDKADDQTEVGRMNLARQRLRRAESRLKALSQQSGRSYLDDQTDLSRAVIVSPIKGQVTWLNLDLAPGYPIKPGQALAVIENLERLIIVSRVHEIDFPKVKPGQRVEVLFDAFPDRRVPAELIERPKAARTGFEAPFTEYEIIFETANQKGELVGGLSADIIVYLVEKKAKMTLPRSCLIKTDGGFKVIESKAGTLVDHRIELGQVGDDMVEVNSGIQSGMRIIRYPGRISAE